ncbi:hypothetical protein AWJ20_4622 [Sugiyamaella lignohabitans]|uniref:TATA-binding protein interacting (TIP20) domain-containing protein n=1 Tax=Sugiyamaella lignohabitans TaxID=796027 RepID=A0A167E5U5_9ASCO|nr:uncharacterized protein AWJ20_4622 [Sugiyamaella lignohabitans]ANB13679.1 hypothetical protein AWJ20_4622 [Sugiyamaella lignohabitans]
MAAGSTEVSSGTISILPMAIRSVILNVTATPSVAHILAESILPGLYTGSNSGLLLNNNSEHSLDSMDILIDLIKRFGSSISAAEIVKTENVLLQIISGEQGIIKKRAVTAMGLLARYLTDKNWEKLTAYLIDGLTESSDLSQLRILIQLAGILARSEPTRFKNDLRPVIDLIIRKGLDVNDEGITGGRNVHRDEDFDDEEEEDNADDDEEANNPELLDLREASLASLEIIVGLGYQAVETQLNDILAISAYYIKYNPNIIDDEDDQDEDIDDEDEDIDDNDDDVEMEGHDGGEDSEFEVSDDEDAFSDDDDQSWKLRRYAAKLAAAVAIYIPTQLPRIYSQLLPPLVSMYASEKESTVKTEVISCLSEFFKAASDKGLYYSSKLSSNIATRRSSDISMATDMDPKLFLERHYLRKLVRVSLSELHSSTNTVILQSILTGILGNLVSVLHTRPSIQTSKIIRSLISLSKTQPGLMIDMLQLVSGIIRAQTTQELTDSLPQLLEIIVLGIYDKYYKVCGAALDVVLDLVAIHSDQSIKVDISVLLPALIEKAKSTSLDLDTRSKAVKALGQFIAKNDLSGSNIDTGCKLILDLLNNEGLRLTSVESISEIASGATVRQVSSKWIISSLEGLGNFLNQSSRTLRIGSLNAILSVTNRQPSSDQATVQALANIGQIILNHGKSILTSSPDAVALDLVSKILTNLVPFISVSEASEFTIQTINQTSSQTAVQISDSILGLLAAVVQHSTDAAALNAVYEELCRPRHVASASAGSSIGTNQNVELAAKALAVVITEGQMVDKIPSFETVVAQNGEDLKWSLLVLGYVGKLLPYTTSLEVLYDELNNNARDEITKTVIANSLGLIISNNVNNYLPDLLNRLKAAGSNTIHLHLLIIREIVSGAKTADVEAYSDDIWNSLFTSLDAVSSSGIGKVALAASTAAAGIVPNAEASVVSGGDLILAECLGRLSILNPRVFLPQLQVQLASEKPSVRVTVLSAVKFTFGQSHDTYDDLLRPIIADFLALVDDDDTGIRQVALSALVSAIHNKSHLLLPHLARLLPLLYRETRINTSLIHTVQMGPFKHKVDNGLELRKTAYETIYTLVSTLNAERLQSVGMIDELLDQVVLGSGLSDEHDIKVLSCVIIGRLASTCLSKVIAAGRLHQITTRYTTLLGVVVKENAIKQEFEKHNEIVRNIERSSTQINDAISQAISKGDASNLPSDLELGEWESFYRTKVLKKSV